MSTCSGTIMYPVIPCYCLPEPRGHESFLMVKAAILEYVIITYILELWGKISFGFIVRDLLEETHG